MEGENPNPSSGREPAQALGSEGSQIPSLNRSSSSALLDLGEQGPSRPMSRLQGKVVESFCDSFTQPQVSTRPSNLGFGEVGGPPIGEGQSIPPLIHSLGPPIGEGQSRLDSSDQGPPFTEGQSRPEYSFPPSFRYGAEPRFPPPYAFQGYPNLWRGPSFYPSSVWNQAPWTWPPFDYDPCRSAPRRDPSPSARPERGGKGSLPPGNSLPSLDRESQAASWVENHAAVQAAHDRKRPTKRTLPPPSRSEPLSLFEDVSEVDADVDRPHVSLKRTRRDMVGEGEESTDLQDSVSQVSGSQVSEPRTWDFPVDPQEEQESNTHLGFDRLNREIISQAGEILPILLTEQVHSSTQDIGDEVWDKLAGRIKAAPKQVFRRSKRVDAALQTEFQRICTDRYDRSRQQKGLTLKPRKDKYAPLLLDDGRPKAWADINLSEGFVSQTKSKGDKSSTQKVNQYLEEIARRSTSILSYMDSLINLSVATSTFPRGDNQGSEWNRDADPVLFMQCMSSLRDAVFHHAEISGNLLSSALLNRREHALSFSSKTPEEIKHALFKSSPLSPRLFGEEEMKNGLERLEKVAVTHSMLKQNRIPSFATGSLPRASSHSFPDRRKPVYPKTSTQGSSHYQKPGHEAFSHNQSYGKDKPKKDFQRARKAPKKH